MSQPQQTPLFDASTVHEDATPKKSGAVTRQTFEEFHAQNPHILEHLRSKALAVKANGWKFFGAKALIESMRFDGRVTTNGQPFKLNNSYVAGYARLLMDTTPELRGFFRVKD